jgi:uroporphyrinogen decarboxylase
MGGGLEVRGGSLGAGGGLILAPTHHVQLDSPLANFWAMVDAVRGTPYPAAATAP